MNIINARKELTLGKSIYDMNLRVVNYDRVSTDKEEQLNSLQNQANYFNDMISSVEKWNHVGSYEDEGISGTQVHKRDDFLRMIEDARLGKFDMIITKEISRFARNTIDSIKYTELLLSYGVIVFFLSDNINTIYPDSEFRLTLMASMAQDEVRKLSERVKFGIRRSIKDGKVGGGGIYGYTKKDGKLYINEDEAEVVKMIFSLYSSEEYGFARIGEILAEKGIFTRKGKVFSDTTLKKMIINPRYKGWYTANLSEVESYKTHKKVAKPREEWVMYKDEKGNIPQIVSEEIWNKANEIHNRRKKVWNKNVLNQESYIERKSYTSKIFCAEHNTTFIRSGSGKRKNNPVWQCNEFLRHGIKGCETPRLYEKHLDIIFTSMLERFIENKDELLNNIIEDYKKLIENSNKEEDTSSLEIKIKEQELYKERLLDLSLKKMISDEDFIEKNKKITNDIRNLKNELVKLESSKDNVSYYGRIVEEIKNKITPKMDIKNNIGRYFNLFVDKVFVSKIKSDRKHVKLQMILNFKSPSIEIEIDDRKNSEENDNQDDQKNPNLSLCTGSIPLDDSFFAQKYLLLNPQQSWIC
ncbi:MAG: recombinase family protein [bacterium]|nr:recombinase family protein [bacterium]